MAYTSGIASNYKDLLALMVTFATANGWSVLEQTAEKVFLKGAGLAGLDEIYCGVETYEEPLYGRFNWQMAGSWGYKAGRTISQQPCNSYAVTNLPVVGYFTNGNMYYWIVANPRRIILVAQVGLTIQMIHLGLLTPPATDAQYPYPLFIGGSGNDVALNTSGLLYSFWSSGYSRSRLSVPAGRWGDCNSTGTAERPAITVTSAFAVFDGILLTAPDGSFLLDPIFVTASYNTIYGQIEGLYRVTGYANSAEDVITVDGVNYIIFQDGSRSGDGDCCALRMA